MSASINWGSVPDWIAGIGSAGALIGGVLVIRHQLRDLVAAASQRETALVAHLAFWAEWDAGRCVVVVHNACDFPFLSLDAWVDGRAGVPGEIQGIVEFKVAMLPPGETRRLAIPLWDRFEAPLPADKISIDLTCTDFLGRHWRLHGGVAPRRLDHRDQDRDHPSTGRRPAHR